MKIGEAYMVGYIRDSIFAKFLQDIWWNHRTARVLWMKNEVCSYRALKESALETRFIIIIFSKKEYLNKKR